MQLVTVIIPVYNESKHLAETLESVLAQTYNDLIIRISDNASADGTLDIAKKFAIRDGRIEIIEQQSTIPAGKNFKLLIDSVTSPLTFIMGGHDVLKKDCIEKCIMRISEDNIVCVYPEASFFGSANKFQNPNSEIGWVSRNKLERYTQLIKNLNYGTAVYSLYDTRVLRSIEFASVLGADLYWLFQVASHGSIVSSETLGFLRREDRIETVKSRKQRYLSYVGVMEKDFSFYPIIFRISELIDADTEILNRDKQTLYRLIVNRYQKNSMLSLPRLLNVFNNFNSQSKLKMILAYTSYFPSMIYFAFLRIGKGLFGDRDKVYR